jgi:hypothetical protein
MHYSSLFLVLNKHYSSIFAFECKDVLPAPYHIVPTIWPMGLGISIQVRQMLKMKLIVLNEYGLMITWWTLVTQ